MAYRGLYGCAEGNETRNKDAQWADRQRENEIVEGEWLKPMIASAKKGNLKELGRLRDSMKSRYVKQGVAPLLAQERADSCLRQAMAHLRV